MIASAVGTRNIPGSARELSSLPEPDYADRFTLSTDAQASPEQWARAMFGDVPSAGEVFIWRVLLGLRLSRSRSPDTVAGWRIGDRGDTWIRLDAGSWYLGANLLVQTGPGSVSLTTLLHYERRLGAAVWPPLSAVHRHLVPGLLHTAAAKIRVRRLPGAVPDGDAGTE